MAAKVFTTVPGLVLRVGDFGEASNDSPAIVPDQVALQFEREIAGEYVSDEDEQDPANPGKTRKKVIRYAKARTDIRVERDKPAPKAPAPQKGKE